MQQLTVRAPDQQSVEGSDVRFVILPGSLVMADQVRYMVNKVTRDDCRRPDLGWDSCTH